MNTQTITDFKQPVFFAWRKEYEDSGKIHETTLGAFLYEFVEDPATAWIKKENEDGRIEVRTNYRNQLRPGQLHGTFDTREEAEQFILEGLYWDLCNNYTGEVSYDFDRAELVKFMNEITHAI